ncbi:hypothetical protein NDU88_003741 [Pleurodeles waltl]|uniref:Uncharacterized protein n=1 Tax=Pleurodeles waltl TaxID=8319 RepID=A0AAV7N0Z7_PLEWA|nr:hypothetical protein NDU88_003741 [Pleurodeles waltl]
MDRIWSVAARLPLAWWAATGCSGLWRAPGGAAGALVLVLVQLEPRDMSPDPQGGSWSQSALMNHPDWSSVTS